MEFNVADVLDMDVTEIKDIYKVLCCFFPFYNFDWLSVYMLVVNGIFEYLSYQNVLLHNPSIFFKIH